MVDGRNVRMRPSEALYLYERLVLHRRPMETMYRYAIQRLREQYGADFLAEIFEHSPSGGLQGRIRREAFERILQEYLEKDGRMVYEEWAYHFDFLNRSYIWDGEELRITPKEAVFLYECTILHLQGKRKVHRYTAGSTLYDMRKKFGSEFLGELFPNKQVSPGLDRRAKNGYVFEGDT